MSDLLFGTVKMWNLDRGFGFIAADHGEDIFVHVHEVKDKQPLSTGERVAFVIGQGRDGRPRAMRVEAFEE